MLYLYDAIYIPTFSAFSSSWWTFSSPFHRFACSSSSSFRDRIRSSLRSAICAYRCLINCLTLWPTSLLSVELYFLRTCSSVSSEANVSFKLNISISRDSRADSISFKLFPSTWNRSRECLFSIHFRTELYRAAPSYVSVVFALTFSLDTLGFKETALSKVRWILLRCSFLGGLSSVLADTTSGSAFASYPCARAAESTD